MVKSSSHTKLKPKAKKAKKPFPVAAFFSILITISLIVIIAVVAIINFRPATDYVVETNAFFAPFEFFEGSEIKGVDVDIINRVATKLNKTFHIKHVDFSVIIDNVASGKLADAGAAGLTITESRAEKVDFSIPYYTSVQYVIFDPSRAPANNGTYITWEALKGKIIGTQTDTTGYIFSDSEIKEGSLVDTNATLKGFDSAQLAADGINANLTDVVIVDQLPAEYIVAKNSSLTCLPLYFTSTQDGITIDAPVEESYAIAVNKSRPELLSAFNEVLTEMLSSGEINDLVLKYMGI